MQAFGAYAKKEVIDFEKLGTEQIFVISGKTGQGNPLFLTQLALRFWKSKHIRSGKFFHAQPFCDGQRNNGSNACV